MRIPQTLRLRNQVTPSTAKIVITMITRRGTGNVISIHSIPPRIHFGAVTSTLRDVARAMRLIWDASPPASSTPPKADTAQVMARLIRALGPSKRRCGNTNGKPNPRTNAKISPAACARGTLRTNCCSIKLTPQVANNVSNGLP